MSEIKNEVILIKKVLTKFYDKISMNEFVIDKTGVKTVEILGLRLELNPLQTILNFYDLRKSPEKYIKQEIEWYDSQDLCIKNISKNAKLWLNVCSKDDKQTVNSKSLLYRVDNFKISSRDIMIEVMILILYSILFFVLAYVSFLRMNLTG